MDQLVKELLFSKVMNETKTRFLIHLYPTNFLIQLLDYFLISSFVNGEADDQSSPIPIDWKLRAQLTWEFRGET